MIQAQSTPFYPPSVSAPPNQFGKCLKADSTPFNMKAPTFSFNAQPFTPQDQQSGHFNYKQSNDNKTVQCTPCAHKNKQQQAGNSLYKTEQCKNWIEQGYCRYGNKCQFAHGTKQQLSRPPQTCNQFSKTSATNATSTPLVSESQMMLNEEMLQMTGTVKNPEKYKTQNCRVFHQELFCAYGSRCLFRHEFRSFEKIHRHYYQCHLATIDLRADTILTSDADDQPSQDMPVKRLSVFNQIIKQADLKVDIEIKSDQDYEETMLTAHNSSQDNMSSIRADSSETEDFSAKFDTPESFADQDWPEFTPSDFTFFLNDE